MIEADTRRPIAAVEVAAGARTQKTARDGSFQIDVGEHRTLSVRARKGKRTTLHHEAAIPRGDSPLEIAIPRYKLPARKPTDVVIGDGRQERATFEAGESILATARGLEPAAAYVVRIVGAKKAVIVEQRFVSDRAGVLGPIVAWPDPGLETDATLAEAHDRLAGRAFRLEIFRDRSSKKRKAPLGKAVRTAKLSFAAALSRPRLLPVDGAGKIRRGIPVDHADGLLLAVSGFAADTLVDLHLVRRQYEWRVGDAFAPIVTRRVKGDGLAQLMKQGELALGSYDVIARAVVDNEWLADETRLRTSDVVSEPAVTTIVIRDDLFRIKPVHLGCIAMVKDIACRRVQHDAPYVEFTDTFTPGEDIYVALDPAGLLPIHVGRKVRITICRHRSGSAWDVSRRIVEPRGVAVEIVLQSWCLNANLALAWPNAREPGDYDVVVDFGNSATDPADFVADDQFDAPADFIDGYFRAGFTIVDDPALVGPHTVARRDVTGPTVPIAAPGWLVDTYPEGDGIVGTNFGSGAIDVTLMMRVHYPATDTAAGSLVEPGGRLPLVVMLHGEGYGAADMDGLGAHLASHGYLAASCQFAGTTAAWTGDCFHDIRGRLILECTSYLAALDATPGDLFFHRIDTANLIVGGHSRGGDGALFAGSEMERGATTVVAKGVFALAPTDISGYYGPLTVLRSIPYFAMQGTNDEDVGRTTGAPYWSSGLCLRAYDRIDSEKALALVVDATHSGFSDRGTPGPLPPDARVLPSAQHAALTRGYILAFVRYVLSTDPDSRRRDRGFLSGDVRIVSAGVVDVRMQYRAPAAQRLVIDDLESGFALDVASSGDAVSPTVVTRTYEDRTSRIDTSTPHVTRALQLRWDRPSNVVWRSSAPRDLSRWRYLSFRVGQPYGFGSRTYGIESQLDGGVLTDALLIHLRYYCSFDLTPAAALSVIRPGFEWLIADGAQRFQIINDMSASRPLLATVVGRPAPPLTDLDFFVRLTSADGRSRGIRIASFGRVPPPSKPSRGTTPGYPPGWLDADEERRTMATMNTVHLPLSAFSVLCLTLDRVDLSAVTEVRLDLGDALASARGDIFLDDLELSEVL